MYDIEIANQQSHLEIDEDFLSDVVEKTLQEERVQSAEISLALIDNTAIWQLNREYLGHDEATDVLSFLLESEPDAFPAGPGNGVPRAAGMTLSGEVIVSAEMALQKAAEYGWNPRDELVLYVVHGVLHLCGYDDLTEPEQVVMRAREREVLQQWSLVPHFDESEPAEPGAPSLPAADNTAGADS